MDDFFTNAYFQGGGGVNEPSPGKKKYKSDKAIVVQPRFKEPFYRNYDVYDVPGPDGKPSELGPGSGWHGLMKNYKSIADFLKAKRKRMKDKYKAEDNWIKEDTSSRKTERKQKMKARSSILCKLTKYAIDFPIDDSITPILGDAGAYSDSIPIGGMLDEYLPLNDFEGKSPDKLDFGRDYADVEEVEQSMDETINPAENAIYGLPDGILPIEDLDQPGNENPWYGTTDSGNTVYNEMWI